VTASLSQYRVAQRLLARLLDAADADAAITMIVIATDSDGEAVTYCTVPPQLDDSSGQVYRTVITDVEAGLAAVAPFWADATPPEAGP
jgi:hypothetical protein